MDLNMDTDQQTPSMVHGLHAVRHLVENRANEIDKVLIDHEVSEGELFELMKYCRKIRINYQLVPARRLAELAPDVRHQGVIALCASKAYDTTESMFEKIGVMKNPILLVPASIEDPRNLGAIIRSSVAFGVAGILLERKNTVVLSDTVARTSAGMLEHISIIKPRSLEAVVTQLREQGFAVIAACSAGGTPVHECDLKGPTILIVGGEHKDIPPYLLKLCTGRATIPMAAQPSSLNVSVATAIMLYESNRQRVGTVQE